MFEVEGSGLRVLACVVIALREGEIWVCLKIKGGI